MADKQISDLVAASSVQAADLFVLEQTGTAKKLTGQILINWMTAYADGHGGIQTIAKTGTSGLVDTYTITYADATTSAFTVTNGAKGDTGDSWYIHIKYSARMPTSDADMGDTPEDYIGIYSGTSSTAPAHHSSYDWFQWKGNTGNPSELVSSDVTYQSGGNTIPTGVWTAEIPSVAQGDYLWTRTVFTFNTGSPVTIYTKSRQGVDGVGVAGDNLPLPCTNAGAVGTSESFAREDHQHPFTKKTLTVSSSSSADIFVNDGAIQTLNRSIAVQYGDLVVFSFVATVKSSVNASTMLFQIAEGLMPSAQIDFVLLSSTAGAISGQLIPTSTYGNRIINTPTALSGGTIRAEISWIIS